MPGTHDSASISSVPFVGTQRLRIDEQLTAGIRYFDIRAGFYLKREDIQSWKTCEQAKVLIAYHNFYDLTDENGDYITISHIFKICYEFLEENENECIFLQIKQDWPTVLNDGDTTIFEKALTALIKQAPKGRPRWRLEDTLPTLGDLRGRIQLVRRYAGVLNLQTSGIDVYRKWPNLPGPSEANLDNHPDFTVVVQDKWEWGADLDVCRKKFDLVAEYLWEAFTNDSPKYFYINFASATARKALLGATRVALGWWYPDLKAAIIPITTMGSEGVNKSLAAFFNDKAQKGCYGTVLMDYAEQPGEMIMGLVKTNFTLKND